jgi:hypothetical protein
MPNDTAPIIIAKYPVRHVNAFAHISEERIRSFPQMVVSDEYEEGARYSIGWGIKIPGGPGCVMESGFFWDSAHIDTAGMYSKSSLNTEAGYSEVMAHKERPLPELKSKYSQTNSTVKWDGVVLASQTPSDRSINYRGTPEDYWTFLEGACRYYKKHLFIKLHPWNNGEVGDRILRIANVYGCRAEKCDHSVISSCRFVLAYNSTFLVDCMVRGVKAVGFVPGAFSRYTGCTNGGYPDAVEDLREVGRLLVNFLAYRYCFNHTMTAEKTIRMFEHFAASTALFPMNDEYCYALNPSDPSAKGRRHHHSKTTSS